MDLQLTVQLVSITAKVVSFCSPVSECISTFIHPISVISEFFVSIVIVFNATFNNISVISWQSVLLMEETGENHRPSASHWQTLSHNIVTVSSAPWNVLIHSDTGEQDKMTVSSTPWNVLIHSDTGEQDKMTVSSTPWFLTGFTTTYAISAYHHYCCEFECHSCRGVLDTTLCDKVCQW
jgi:hypothetical protein